MLTGQDLIIALVVITAGATVMGSVGFGLGLVVTPVLLLLLEPQTVVVLVNGEIAVLTVLLLARTWRHLQLKPSLMMAAGGVAAAPVGVLILGSAGPEYLRIAVAVLVLGLVGLLIVNVQLPWARRPWSGAVAGFLASVSITALSIGGPLAAFYTMAQGWEPRAIRASLALYFLTFEIMAFALYAWIGLVHTGTLLNIGALLPGVLAGFGVGSFLAGHLDQRAFRWASMAVIVTSSLVLFGRELTRL